MKSERTYLLSRHTYALMPECRVVVDLHFAPDEPMPDFSGKSGYKTLACVNLIFTLPAMADMRLNAEDGTPDWPERFGYPLSEREVLHNCRYAPASIPGFEADGWRRYEAFNRQLAASI